MKTAISANNNGGVIKAGYPLMAEAPVSLFHGALTVQQTLYKWYKIMNALPADSKSDSALFPPNTAEQLEQNLQTDIELIPALLIEEMVNHATKYDKTQYIRLAQALLVNIGDAVFLRENNICVICDEIDQSLQFIQDFFYQHFDFTYRIPHYRLYQLQQSIGLKLDYWKIKLNHSPLIDVLANCLTSDHSALDNYISFAQLHYLTNLFKQIELAAPEITENLIRQLLISNNFNAECFVDYEMKSIAKKIDEGSSFRERIAFLNEELSAINQLAVKSGTCYDVCLPNLKKLLSTRIQEEICQAEQCDRKENQKDLFIDPNSKIQTTLSVAKLAVLIRLLVADKIIINKSIAPVLRMVAKLFTTLQKDEISVGSLETKYHAPDKATLMVMKETMQKWAGILNKL